MFDKKRGQRPLFFATLFSNYRFIRQMFFICGCHLNKIISTGLFMLRLNALIAFKFLVFSAFVGLISLSPSLNIIPKSLIVTSFHDSQRLLELLLIGLVLLNSIAVRNRELYFSVSQTMRYALYVLIALAIASSYLAKSPRHAMIEISLFAGLTYLTLFVVRLYHENNILLIKRLTYAFWASILLYMVSFYVGYITATIFNTPVKWPAPLTGFSSIRSFNQYQLWTLGLITLPLLAFDFKSTYTRRWLHLGLVCWWVLLFYSASRGALLAWFFGILITAVIYRKSAWPFIRLQLIHITAGFFSYEILFQLIPRLRGSALVTGTIMRDTTSDRIELWNNSINLIQDHPIFGVGAMHFAWYSQTSAHPHNSVLQVMAEWGLPAALLILAMACYGLLCWLKKFNANNLQADTRFNRNLAIVLFFTVITSAAYSLVDGVIVMPISQVMMFTFIGLMIGYYSDGQLAEVKRKSLFRPFLASMVLITLVWSTLPEILQSATGSEKRFSMGYTAIGPRFWLELK
ncbi:MAG: O-antigen ligase family protein [Methylotenera sp.]